MSAAARAQALRARREDLGVDAIIISAPANVRYVTGFSGEGWAVIGDESAIVTDGRYRLRAEEESPDCRLIVRTGSMRAAVVEHLREIEATRVGFEGDHITVSERDDLAADLEDVALVPHKGVLREARMVKGEDEIAVLRRAVAATDVAFDRVVADLRPGVSEKELALEVERQLLLAGADKPAFDIIAASGPNAAHPHAEPSDRVLEAGDIVKLDFGARIDGYHADLTRTVFLGDPDDKQREVYRVVCEAQTAATAVCASGVPGKDVDTAARDVIADAGYGEYFAHGLGHGVGLEIHEGPALGQTSEDTLQAGMLATIEPGIYLEGWGGVRIEDIVLVTNDGCEVLTAAPKLWP